MRYPSSDAPCPYREDSCAVRASPALTSIVDSGSLRTGSFHTTPRLRGRRGAARRDGAHRDDPRIPLYDADVERAGTPPAVAALKDAVAAADGLLLVTPEYNNGIPGVFKNAIDWLSSPTPDLARVFGGKPVGLMGASPGGFGVLSQGVVPVLRALGASRGDGRCCSRTRVARSPRRHAGRGSPACRARSLHGGLRRFRAGARAARVVRAGNARPERPGFAGGIALPAPVASAAPRRAYMVAGWSTGRNG